MLEINKIYNMDCLKGMRFLEKESIHLEKIMTIQPNFQLKFQRDLY